MNHTEATQYIKQTLATFSPRDNIPRYTWVKLYEAMSVLIERPEQPAQPHHWREEMKEAVKHYEAALKAAFPNGQTGTVVLYHWNEARASLEQLAQPQRKPLTDEEKEAIWKKHSRTLGGWDHGGTEVIDDNAFDDAVSAIEAAHGIK